MSDQITLHESDSDDLLKSLENDIASLEKELTSLEYDLNNFDTLIRSQLHSEIIRIRELTELYKSQKQAKKAKRLEQKKKGKNYKEPKSIQKNNLQKKEVPRLNDFEQQELKRLYKEAIIHVHPDKFASEDEEKTAKATALTLQLNAIYKSGDLEELNSFHEHIISGNAMSHVSFQPQTITNSKSMVTFLQKKKNDLILTLAQIKDSQRYEVFKTYDQETFIKELRLQFEERIIQLERRTRSRMKE